MKRAFLVVIALASLSGGVLQACGDDGEPQLTSASERLRSSELRGLQTGFADYFFEAGTPGDRATLLDEARAAGARIVRLEVSWRGIAPDRPREPRDPADPGYDFAVLDAAVREATDRGLAPLLTLAGAPSWAEGPDRPDTEVAPSGSWRPDPDALGAFGTALARRYSGGFAPSDGGVLPRVRYFEAWNEPNLPTFLTPQWEAGEPVAVETYRAMLSAFYDGVKSIELEDLVIAGALAPYGDPPGGLRTRPLEFLRHLLCLDTGGSADPAECPEPAKFDVLSHHTINSSGGPERGAIDPDDISTADLYRIRRALREAERGGTVGTEGPHPLWATELWWESDPPDREHGVPLATQARWIEQALYLVWKQGADVAILLQLRDDPYEPVTQPDALQAGVLFGDGTRKPSFTAFRFPFVIAPAGAARQVAWWKAPRPGSLTIERRGPDGWSAVEIVTAEAGEVGTAPIEAGAGLYRATVDGERSLAWRQP